MEFTFTRQVKTDEFGTWQEMVTFMMQEFKAEAIEKALSLTSGNKTRAANALNIDQPNMNRIMRDLGVQNEREGS